MRSPLRPGPEPEPVAVAVLQMLAGLDPNRRSNWDSHNILYNMGRPDDVALLVLMEWDRRSQGDEGAGGEDVVDEHFWMIVVSRCFVEPA